MLEVQRIGNLGQDPEARYTAEGTLVVSFPVAATRRWTDRDGQKHEETTWVDVMTWGGLAEVCHQHLAKGRQVFVRGRPEVRAFTRKNGEVGYMVSDGPGGRMENVTVELADGQHAPILAGQNLDILIYLLEDVQFRRIEP